MNITLETAEARDQLNQIVRQLPRQADYAAAVALTRTAQDAQKEVRRQLPSRFIMRTRWVPKGIRVKMARKSNLESVVWVKDQFMMAQEVGGTGESSVPIGARPSPQAVTRKSKWPSKLLEKPKHFIAPVEKGSDDMVLWRRRYKKKRYPLRLMYVFEQGGVEIKPRFGFRETVEQVANTKFVDHFEAQLSRALASAT